MVAPASLGCAAGGCGVRLGGRWRGVGLRRPRVAAVLIAEALERVARAFEARRGAWDRSEGAGARVSRGARPAGGGSLGGAVESGRGRSDGPSRRCGRPSRNDRPSRTAGRSGWGGSTRARSPVRSFGGPVCRAGSGAVSLRGRRLRGAAVARRVRYAWCSVEAASGRCRRAEHGLVRRGPAAQRPGGAAGRPGARPGGGCSLQRSGREGASARRASRRGRGGQARFRRRHRRRLRWTRPRQTARRADGASGRQSAPSKRRHHRDSKPRPLSQQSTMQTTEPRVSYNALWPCASLSGWTPSDALSRCRPTPPRGRHRRRPGGGRRCAIEVPSAGQAVH